MEKSDSTYGMPGRKTITIREVAELAGVSMATVSRVLNGSDRVDPQLAKRVQSAIASLKYQPNRAARTLAGSRSTLLGLLVTDIQNAFFMEVMRAVEALIAMEREKLRPHLTAPTAPTAPQGTIHKKKWSYCGPAGDGNGARGIGDQGNDFARRE